MSQHSQIRVRLHPLLPFLFLPPILLLAVLLIGMVFGRAKGSPPVYVQPAVVTQPAVAIPFTFATYSDPQKDLAKRVEALEKELRSLKSARAGRIPAADSAVFKTAVQAKCQSCHSTALAAEVGGGFVLPGAPSELSAASAGL